MPTTEHFFVSTSDNKIKNQEGNSADYFTGKKKGQAKMLIEVFATNNHKKEAEKIADAISNAGLSENYFSVKVSVR